MTKVNRPYKLSAALGLPVDPKTRALQSIDNAIRCLHLMGAPDASLMIPHPAITLLAQLKEAQQYLSLK